MMHETIPPFQLFGRFPFPVGRISKMFSWFSGWDYVWDVKIFDLARYHMSDLDKIGGVPVVMRESIGFVELSLKECWQTERSVAQIAIWEDCVELGKSDSSCEELLDAGLLHGDCMTVTGRRSAFRTSKIQLLLSYGQDSSRESRRYSFCDGLSG